MKTSLRCTLLFLIAVAVPGLAQVTVTSPGSGADVSSPFTLAAHASSCSSQAVASIGYSLDNSSATTIIGSTSISTPVTAAAGQHTLRVKTWGNKGASCVTNVGITVTAQATSGISVSSPASGSEVSSPFRLAAQASTCSSQPVTGMGYSLDNSGDTTMVKGSSVSVSVTSAEGSHTLHVKAWGSGGAACDKDVPISVSAAESASTASLSVNVSSPGNGAQVTSPFELAADASSCSSQPIGTMGYSLDSSVDTTMFSGSSISTKVAAGNGSHTVHVKAWGNKGAVCVTDVAVDVTGGASSSVVPSDAISVSSIQTLSSWTASYDTKTSGSSSGSMSMVGSPSRSGHTRKFVTHFTSGAGERYTATFADDRTSTNFFYDGWIYLNSSSSTIANIEMDMNQTMTNGQTVIMGVQCDGYNGTWDYTENKGTPQKPSGNWVHTGVACNPRSWSINTWHHVQVSYSHNSSGAVTYKAIWLDGTEHAINATAKSAYALGWGSALSTNFQVDGHGASGTPVVYLDDLTLYRW